MLESCGPQSRGGPVNETPLIPGQFRAVPEHVEGGWICEGVGVSHRATVDHIAHGYLRDLPADGARHVIDRDDDPWDMMRTGMLTNPSADRIAQGVIQRGTRA